MDQQVERFKRQYYQQLPPRSFRVDLDSFQDDDENDSGKLQERILSEALLQTKPVIDGSYQLQILRYLMRKIEQSGHEVNHGITELYAQLVCRNSHNTLHSLSSSAAAASSPRPSETVEIHYLYNANNEYISIRESPAILAAEGTTGLRTWEAALSLGNYLLNNSDNITLPGKRVLELGAGTGFLSILCARLQAAHVIATDGSDRVVESLRHNIALNCEQDTVGARQLWFGEAITAKEGEAVIDVVLGADVTYDESILLPFCMTLSNILKANPKAIVLIAATVRREQT